MALGAIDVLRENGLRVPQDVAVAGFDGIEEGRYLTPPLTTVIQPLGELGSRAVDLLVERMDGAAPTEQVLNCTPAIRQSCGCRPRMGPDADLAAVGKRATPAERRVIDRLADLARKGDAEGFIARLDAALATSTIDDDLPKWNDFLAVVRRTAFPRGTRRRYRFCGAVRVCVGTHRGDRQPHAGGAPGGRRTTHGGAAGDQRLPRRRLRPAADAEAAAGRPGEPRDRARLRRTVRR